MSHFLFELGFELLAQRLNNPTLLRLLSHIVIFVLGVSVLEHLNLMSDIVESLLEVFERFQSGNLALLQGLLIVIL